MLHVKAVDAIVHRIHNVSHNLVYTPFDKSPFLPNMKQESFSGDGEQRECSQTSARPHSNSVLDNDDELFVAGHLKDEAAEEEHFVDKKMLLLTLEVLVRHWLKSEL